MYKYLISSTSTCTLLLRPTTTIHQSFFSSNAMGKFEYLVICPDRTGVEAKRLEVRPTHFANLKTLVSAGTLTWGGAMLNSVPTPSDPSSLSFRGSVLTCVAESEDEVWELVRGDVYSKEGVWDLEKVQVIPFKCAVREPLRDL